MSQELYDLYANVQDTAYGAYGDGTHDDTHAIQLAIDNAEGRHVLFPAGFNPHTGLVAPYVITAPLKFTHAHQRCVFLAGALLEFQSDAARVEITAPSQTFVGLRLHTGTANGFPIFPDPCLLIDGADDLLLEDVYVACGTATTLVRITNTLGVTFEGGLVDGLSAAVGNTGLEIGAGAANVGALSLAINNIGHGVVFTGSSAGISLVNGTVEGVGQNAVEVRAGACVRGLSFTGVHMEAGIADGAFEFVVVQESGGVSGGSFRGCIFGGFNPTVDTTPRRIFRIGGTWQGVSVAGCQHLEGGNPVDAYVWELEDTASVSRSSDLFNFWDRIPVATGPRAGDLSRVASDFGKVSFGATAVRIVSDKIGFFKADPVPRPAAYEVGPGGSRRLVAGNEQQVLARLLRDLADLGLLRCTVQAIPPR